MKFFKKFLLYSYAATDKCRKDIVNYETCKSKGKIMKENPIECENETIKLVDCYNKNETIEPICIKPFNDARECLF